MWIRMLAITACGLVVSEAQTGKEGVWEELFLGVLLSLGSGGLVLLLSLPWGRPAREAPWVGAAAWAIALAAVPTHPMNFCANGGREDFAFAYLPMALVAGPLAWLGSWTPLGRATLGQVALVSALLLALAAPSLSQGYLGALVASRAYHASLLLLVLALLHLVLTRAWAWLIRG
jgi:hypothetical protein